MAATPLHAYVPGKTSRHPDGAFDSLRASVRPGMSAAELADSAAFTAGLMFFEEGFFWEAHEVLEPVWMALPKGSPDRHAVEAVIQIANARLKLRMERPKAVLRLCDMAEALVDQSNDKAMGVSRDQLRDWILATRQMTETFPE